MIDNYKVLNNNYQKVINKPDKFNFFDNLIVPFVASLHYEINTGASSSVGTFIINHQKNICLAFPDKYSKIVFTLNDYSNLQYQDNILIINFKMKDKHQKIQLLIPYYHQYCPLIEYEFNLNESINEKHFKLINYFLDYQQHSQLKDSEKQSFIYRLIVTYDLMTKKDDSQLLLASINYLLNSANDELINLIVNHVSQNLSSNSGISKGDLFNHFKNILLSKDNHYQLTNQDRTNNETHNQVNDNLDLKSLAHHLMSTNNNEEHPANENVINQLFKQR